MSNPTGASGPKPVDLMAALRDSLVLHRCAGCGTPAPADLRSIGPGYYVCPRCERQDASGEQETQR